MSDHDIPDAAKLLHLGTRARGEALTPPISLTSMYHLPGEPGAGARGYGRSDNTTWEALEAALSHLEAAPALAFPSGMAAITAALFSTLKTGDRLLLPSDGYYTTRLLADRFLAALGVHVETRPTAHFADGGFAGISVAFIETPSNPGLDLVDLAAVTTAIRAAGGTSIVDNTLMTSFGQRPLDLGADILVASDTKAPGGHSDILMGHVASRDAARFEAMSAWRTLSGAIPGPQEAWLLHRSLATLELRFARLCDNAETLAPRLAAHPAVRALRYPGLAQDPAQALAARQMIRPGFVIGLTLADSAAAERFIAATPLVEAATSFGGVHSSAERRARWGDVVAPGFVRLSVGAEPVEPLWAALNAGLTASQEPG